MKINKKLLITCIAIPVFVGVLASVISGGGMRTFAEIDKPPLSPPAWLFPVVWTILYILMGISSYLIIESSANQNKIEEAIRVYVYQLIVNFLWPTFFFNLEWYFFSLLWLILLWVLVLCMIVKFAGISKIAALINIPYLIWLIFAAYLNFGIWMMN